MTGGVLPRGLAALTRAYLLDAFRSKTSLFWNFAFPVFFLFAFAVGLADSRPEAVTYLMPGLFTLTIVAISFAGVSYRLIAEREKEVLRRYRTTPVRAGTVVGANAQASVVVLGASLALLAATAFLAFRVRVTGGGLELVAVLLAGAAAFVPLGLILGSLTPSMRTAPAVTNAIFFPLIFVSGAAIPFALLPGWVQDLGRLVPATYLVEALQAVMVRGESWETLSGPLAILLATGAVGGVLSAWLFRWEAREPVERGRLLAAAGILTLFFALLGALGPPLHIAGDAGPLRDQLREKVGRGPTGSGSLGAGSRHGHPDPGALPLDDQVRRGLVPALEAERQPLHHPAGLLGLRADGADVLLPDALVDGDAPPVRGAVHHDLPLVPAGNGVQGVGAGLQPDAADLRRGGEVERGRLVGAQPPRLPVRHQVAHDLATACPGAAVADLGHTSVEAD